MPAHAADLNTLTRTWSGTHGTEPWGDLDLRLTDTCLRDGSHHKRHQFTATEVHDIVEALDASGVPVIEVTHGDGLGGSSFNYGFSRTPEQELIRIAAETAKRAKIVVKGEVSKAFVLKGIAATAGAKAAIIAAGGKLAE